jgi:hypothetical protein
VNWITRRNFFAIAPVGGQGARWSEARTDWNQASARGPLIYVLIPIVSVPRSPGSVTTSGAPAKEAGDLQIGGSPRSSQIVVRYYDNQLPQLPHPRKNFQIEYILVMRILVGRPLVEHKNRSILYDGGEKC